MNTADAELARILWPGEAGAPERELECRHCSQPNEVSVAAALLDTDHCHCGGCGRPLFIGNREPLTGLSSDAYRHSLDQKSAEALTALPGLGRLTKWVLNQTLDRHFRVTLMADSVRCSEAQFPELLTILDVARSRLGFTRRPALFLSEDANANAYTSGVEDQVVVVYTGLLDVMEDRQLLAVIGHELGHIHGQHIHNHVLAQVLLRGGSALTGIGQLLTWPITKAMLTWQRCAELTADRAALLATRDLRASIEIFMNLSGGSRPGVARRTTLRIAPFVEQARELAELESSSTLDGLAALIMSLDRSHPFSAWRLMHLLQWAEQGSYLEILAGRYPRA